MTNDGEQRRNKLTWRDLYWALVFLIVVGMAIGLWYFYLAFWQLPWGGVLLGLSILAVPILFLIRWRSSDRFWRENRWIIMPAIILVLILLNSAWASVFISSTYLQESQVKVFEVNPECKLYVSYPSYIVYEGAAPAEIHLRMVCENLRIRPLIYLENSIPKDLLLSLEEQGKAWKNRVEVVLPGDGTDTIIYARVANAHVKFLSLIISGVSTNIELSVQTSEFKKHLEFFVNLLQSGSLFFTIIGAIFAGLKQLDEQKINERKRAIDALLGRMSNFRYENGNLSAFVEEIAVEIRDWGEVWTKDQKSRFQTTCPQLFKEKKDLWQEATRLPNAANFIETTGAVCETTGIARPGALADLEISYPGYKRESAASYYPPEDYPLAKIFAKNQCVQLDADNASLDNLRIELWGMRFHPYLDWKSPFYYSKIKGKDRYFPLLDEITFSYPTEQGVNQPYYFLTGWDLHAGLYKYLLDYSDDSKSKPLGPAKETFFVPVFPENLPAWQDDIHFLDYLLHALAGAWMRTLAHNPYLIEENTSLEQQIVAELLVKRYDDSAAVKRELFAQFKNPKLPLSPSADFLKLLDQVSPKRISSRENLAGLLSLRPFETKYTQYLCADIAPNGDSHGTLSFHLHTPRMKHELQELNEAQSFICHFLLADKRTGSNQVMSSGDLRKLLDSRIRLSTNNLSPLHFSDLFDPPPQPEKLEQFLARANGSPGTIVKMAHDLLARHLEQDPDNPYISPDLLNA